MPGKGDLNNREIAHGSSSDQIRLQFLLANKGDFQILRVRHHVIVREDVALGIDFEQPPPARSGGPRCIQKFRAW